MTNFVNIKSGSYRGEEITNTVFPLVKPVQFGKKGMFVTVDASKVLGADRTAIRVKVPSTDSVEYIENAEPSAEVKAEPVETVDEAKNRIRKRFEILEQMTDAVATGVVRGLIISGLYTRRCTT